MPEPRFVLPLADCHELRLAGGKAVNLARMLTAGLPVPGGFVVTTEAFLAAGGAAAGADGPALPPELVEAVAAAYRAIGSPPVAVRSSATAEDLAEASMAGQYDTFLGVEGEAALLDAIGRCWQSVGSDRIRSYLNEHGIDPQGVAMAVVVQRLVPAEVAGVLFTANPRTGNGDEMLVEASWGLGEAVVSGLVQPDTVALDRTTGSVIDYAAAVKRVEIAAGSGRKQAVPLARQHKRCLTDQNLADLWRLGLAVAEHAGADQDIEWAIHQHKVYLLQSRAVTTLGQAAAYSDLLAATAGALRRWHEAGRGDWVRHNLAETLPHPTPLSWSVVRRFMSGDGGFGQMYRRVGFEPSPLACREGFLELIAGRVYMDLSRAGEMFFERFPFRYDVDLLRSRPDAAQQPPTVPSGSLRQRIGVGRKLAEIQERLDRLAATLDRRLDEEVIPALVAWVAQEKARDLRDLPTEGLIELWRERERRVMDEFGPQALLPGLIAAMAVERLRQFVAERFWEEDADELVNRLAASPQPDQTIRASEALYALAGGRAEAADGSPPAENGPADGNHSLPRGGYPDTLPLVDWLRRYGHRGPEEFDLASPRWRERPDEVRAMAALLAGGSSPVQMHRSRTAEADRLAGRLEQGLGESDRDRFRERLALVRRYLRFREDGKFYLMLGYDLLRDVALEAGRRLDIGENVFLLSFDELADALRTGDVPRDLLAERSARRAAERRLSLAALITADQLDRLGEPPALVGGDRLAATPISAGTCSGPAQVVLSPREAGPLGRGYVLVCPSTDPNWTPLFVNAAGLVLECGGSLSHGAVVARELGIPAVVLPEAMRIVRAGETIAVDGNAGAVLRGSHGAADDQAAADPRDVRIAPKLLPPVRGPRERRAARLRNLMLAMWGVCLAAAFLLPPAWVYDPSIKLLDAVLWPLGRWAGPPATVALLAAGLAALSMAVQRLMTENRRLLAAKQRAARLRREAARLPAGSPRRIALSRAAAPVQGRLMAAALFPLSLILGPVVMSFVWLPARVDPASRSPRPGAVAFVTASVDGEYTQPVALGLGANLQLDPATPARQSVPPIRDALTELLAGWRQTGPATRSPNDPPADKRTPAPEVVTDLERYLEGPIPPQDLVWMVRTPAGRAGWFAVSLQAEGGPPVEVPLVLGDRFPPEPKEDLGDGKGPVQVVRPAAADGPVRLVRVTFRQERTFDDDVFWAPLGSLGWARLEESGWAGWDAGWLLTYLGAYLLVLLPLRWLLRIA